jgi:short-subunit dehydrogenase
MNKHVVITGASSGLGEAMAKNFARRGFNMTLSARRAERLTAVRDTLLKLDKTIDVLIIPGDVGDKQACQHLVDESMKRFSRIDAFVANAGIGMWSRFRDLDDPNQLKDLMQVNYMGVVYSLFYALPHLRASRGSFIAVSSIQGTIPIVLHTGYAASKYAVNGLIESIRLEEPDVHFLLALPAWISGTELRSHALRGGGEDAVIVKNRHGKSAVPADECARRIIDAFLAKKDRVFIPKKYALLPCLRQLLGPLFDRIVANKVKGQLKD